MSDSREVDVQGIGKTVAWILGITVWQEGKNRSEFSIVDSNICVYSGYCLARN